MKELEGKLSLVTGGTRGIGRAIVMALADAGSNVLFFYKYSAKQAEEICDEIRKKGVRANGYQADVASVDSVQKAIKAILSEFGPVDVLVNNAGINRDKSFLKMTKMMWDEVLGVNLDGPFNVTQAVLPAMVEKGWGRIINISSIVGQMGNFGQANYAATKGGLISFSLSLAREVARKGITVNVVAPGFILTDMVRGMIEAAVEQVKNMTPMGRLGNPEEIADAVVFLASPRSSFITGQVLGINGGLYM